MVTAGAGKARAPHIAHPYCRLKSKAAAKNNSIEDILD